MRPHTISVTAVAAAMFATGCVGLSTTATDAQLRADLRAFANDPASNDLDGYDTDGQIDDGQIVVTVTTRTGPCLQATVTWPYGWLLDGTGRGLPSQPKPCPGHDEGPADHARQPERSSS